MILRALFGILLVVATVARAAPPEVAAEQLPRIEPTPAEKAAATFVVRPGFRLELMAAEPLVADPTAIAFDEDARVYVVEMRDYSERRDEKLGRVKLLTDDDGDGKFDRASNFVEGLPWPTAVACWDGGIFVVSSPDLWYFKDTDHDGRADVRAIICTGFGNLTDRLNVQALPNSLQWGPDQRFHLALGGNASKLTNVAVSSQPPLELRGQDLSFEPRKFDLRAETGGGQWGLTFDDIGRKFVCSNSRHLMQIVGGQAVDIAADGPQAEVYRASPVEAWRLLRTEWRVNGVVPGLIEGGGRASGYFTSACGVTIYHGDAYGADFAGNAFIADCGGNLVHRKILSGEIRRTAFRAADEERSEFLAGKDNWFRPVALANAPDGCLWVCDMYREIVEHPWSLPEPIKKRLDLNAGNDRGRLWRVVPETYQPRKSPRMGALSASELVPYLSHANGWHRETAARLLHSREEKSLPANSATAVRVLVGQGRGGEVDWPTVTRGKDAALMLAKLRSAQVVAGWAPERRGFLHEIDQKSAETRFQLTLLAAQLPEEEAELLLQRLAADDVDSADLRAALTATTRRPLPLWIAASGAGQADQTQLARDLAVLLGRRGNAAEWRVFCNLCVKTPSRGAFLPSFAEGSRQAGKSLRSAEFASELAALSQAAAAALRDRSTSREDRIEAIRALGVTGNSDAASELAAGIRSTSNADEVQAALAAIDAIQPPNKTALFAELWPRLPSSAKPLLLQMWRSRPAQALSLLDAIEAGLVSSADISATDIAALRAMGEERVQARVKALFGEVTSREAALETFRPALAQSGAAIAGEVIFKAKCSQCHRKGGEGTAIGPDLDAAVSAGKEKILGNILDPSRELTAGFATGAIETKDGEILSGIMAGEANGDVTLKIPGKGVRTFAPTEIEQFKRLNKSLMPEGIEAGLSVRDMANLLAYLTTPSAAKSSPRLPLRQFRRPDGAVAEIAGINDWKLRRADILARMQTIMGPLPGPDRKVDFAIKVEEETDMGAYVRRLISFAPERDSRLTAYLLVPKKCLAADAKPTAAILCLHPTDNTVGHKVVVGLGGKANRQYAAELAERGFVTIAPSYPLLAGYQPDLKQLGYDSGTMKAIHDNRRTLDYLETLPYVQRGRFGAIGHSLGGHNAVYTAAFDERLVAVVSSCGLDAYADYKQGDITGWTSVRYMPRLAAYIGRAHETPFDFDEILAALAPRAVRIVAPTKDDNFRADSVDRLSDTAREIFQLLGAADKLVVEHPDCGHDFPDEARARAYDFLARELDSR